MRLKTLLIVTILCGIVPATADVIFDNGGPDETSFGPFSDLQQGQGLADDFTLQPGANVIRDVHWWGGYDPEQFGPDDFIVAILEDDGGLPDPDGAFIFLTGTITRSDSGLDDPFGFDIFAYDMVLDTEVALTPNTTYWLAIVNNTDSWFWQRSDESGAHAFGSLDGGNLDDDFGNLAFNLTNDAIVVPEPASMALLGLGLVGLAARRRRSAK